jgi:hypothetical protein
MVKTCTAEGRERIQDGNWDTAVDCESSMNQGPCGDSGNMLG